VQKYCSALALSSIKALGTSGKWSRFAVSLGDFGGRCWPALAGYTQNLSAFTCKLRLLIMKRRPIACSYDKFNGCGGAGWYDLITLEFKNLGGSKKSVCLDGIRLLPQGQASSA
jgi:hypothetical protein